MSKSKDLIKRHSESVTHNTLGNLITAGLLYGGAGAIGLLASYSAFLAALPLYAMLLLGAGVFLIIALALYLLAVALGKFRASQHKLPAGVQDKSSTALIEADPEGSKEALKKAEQKIETLNTQIEGSNQEIRKLQGNADALQMSIASRDAELKQYAWLHERAEVQARDIGRYVVVEQIRFCYHDLTAPIPYLIFGVDIHNKSVFGIAIENTLAGHIGLAGEYLLGDKELVHNPGIPPSSKESLTIKQRLSSVEVELVKGCENNTLGAIYYFDKLVMRVAARAEFPQFESTSLKLPQHVGSKDTPFSTEIASLKAQLEEEKAKRTKPDITGKINRVYFQWWANGDLSNSKQTYFDYHFIINVYLANRGAATTIEQFKLVLKIGEHSYDGEREKDTHDVKEGEMNWREWGAGELDDLEKSNDVPLEHTRNGSIWFVVMGIPKTEDESEMELELYVVDKDGTSYQLDTSPRSKWEKNPFLHEAWVKEERARMKQKF